MGGIRTVKNEPEKGVLGRERRDKPEEVGGQVEMEGVRARLGLGNLETYRDMAESRFSLILTCGPESPCVHEILSEAHLDVHFSSLSLPEAERSLQWQNIFPWKQLSECSDSGCS